MCVNPLDNPQRIGYIAARHHRQADDIETVDLLGTLIEFDPEPRCIALDFEKPTIEQVGLVSVVDKIPTKALDAQRLLELPFITDVQGTDKCN
jgi:hypothetical protein